MTQVFDLSLTYKALWLCIYCGKHDSCSCISPAYHLWNILPLPQVTEVNSARLIRVVNSEKESATCKEVHQRDQVLGFTRTSSSISWSSLVFSTLCSPSCDRGGRNGHAHAVADGRTLYYAWLASSISIPILSVNHYSHMRGTKMIWLLNNTRTIH